MVDIDIEGYADSRLIGRGGFSKVYRARQTEFDRDVALKVLDVDIETDDAKRVFTRECELAGRLTDHPNVVTVFGSGFVPGTSEPFIAMAYASGGSLSGRLAEQGHLDVRESLSIAVQIAGALETAHRHGVVHRDVKPQNIVFQRSGAPALTDFGIAAVAGFAATSMSAQAFTPLHAAPELFKGEPSTPASDVYGLGSTLYCMLEGHPPFGKLGDMPMAVLVRVMADPAPPVTAQKVPAALNAVIASMISKEPDDRPRVDEVIEELNRIEVDLGFPATKATVIDGDPTQMPPSGGDDHTPSRAAASWDRTTTRRRASTGMWLAAAAVVLVVGGLIAALVWPTSDDTPAAVAGQGGITQIEASSVHGCALLPSGKVKCWGQSQFGELGNGKMENQLIGPTDVVGITDAAQISITATHGCALLSSGSVKCWGQNKNGQLGNGSIEDSAVPVTANVQDVKQIAVSEYSTCALITDGSVKCWGGNNQGLLGRGMITGTEANPTPEPVVDVANATQLAGGDWFMCALISDGTAKCWGNGEQGSLGNGKTENSGQPQQVQGLSNAVALSAGYFQACAVIDDGSAKCWGANERGQLGDGTETGRTTAVAVKGLTNVDELALGDGHSCALLDDGTTRCWGSNEFGQLGTTTGTGSDLPVKATEAPRATRIAAGDNFTCAGSKTFLACWGRNDTGQLGNDTKKVVKGAVTVKLT